jgi:hypothetical protein
MTITIPKLSANESLDLQSNLESDLGAYYKTLYDKIMESIEGHEGNYLDDVIHEIGKII